MSATQQEVLVALIALYAVARVDRDEDYAAISIAADVIERASKLVSSHHQVSEEK